ncbi:hypothetical protein I4U23_031487 [Adineta vaga]|nr:hypothetical protein I4U23_031487 [Adineta vaga]
MHYRESKWRILKDFHNYTKLCEQFLKIDYEHFLKKYISKHRLCDDYWDIDSGEDELLSPWLFNKNNYDYIAFYCKNEREIYRFNRCNGKIHCQPDGKDEWLCNLDN